MHRFWKLLGVSVLFTTKLLSLDDVNSWANHQFRECDEQIATRNAFQIYAGPEIYHVHRTRKGGTYQDGTVYGIKAGYERIKRYKVYFGFDALYASGILEGKSGSGNALKSHFSDTYVEGRLGYTFKSKCQFKPSFTPYGGVGYFIEENNFTHPKSTPVHFKTNYIYVALGFLSEIAIKEDFTLGFNFKVKYPYDAKCRVSHDPHFDDTTQMINEEIQYRIEVPLTYQVKRFSENSYISLVPFYELREYGYHPNYPHDFIKTKLNIYGAFIKLMYCI